MKKCWTNDGSEKKKKRHRTRVEEMYGKTRLLKGNDEKIWWEKQAQQALSCGKLLLSV